MEPVRPSQIAFCPLCANTTATEVERVKYASIWAGLAHTWNAAFTDDTRLRHTPSEETRLLECGRCGLQFFDPATPGDNEFYHQLTTTAGAYYSEDKWDFQAALHTLSASDHVLDIACGSGAFLTRLREHGCVAVGIDTNAAAIAVASSKGLSAYCADLDDYASRNSEAFDVVTAFQVLEHVSDPKAFIGAAPACVKPGGRLVLTVPNRDRPLRLDLEPLDCPPHHLTRWSAAQFTTLADTFKCRVSESRFEPASMAECRTILRRKIARAASVAHESSLVLRAIARLAFSPTLYTVYSKVGGLDRWGFCDMSVMCVLEKPR